MRKFSILITLCFLFFGMDVFSQFELTGKVYDEAGLSIPYVNIYIKDAAEQRTQTNIDGEYVLRLEPGEYFLVFQAMGFDDREAYIAVTDRNQTRDMQMFPARLNEYEEIEIEAKRGNPGRDIIKNVVDKKDIIDHNNYPYITDVYIKAKGETDYEEKKDDTNKEEIEGEDPFENEQKQQQQELLRSTKGKSLVEIQLTRNFAPDNNVKEFRNGYSKRGHDGQLYFLTTAKSNFNFFKNILYLNDLNESPIQSPISLAGILSYKYKLIEQVEEDGILYHKIKIIPRSSATTTLEGHIWVQDSTWLVTELDLTLEKGNLYIYDYFQIKQKFDISSDTLAILTDQEFTYGVKNGKQKFSGSTIVQYKNYNWSPTFPKKFFGNELAVTEKEAYEKDSTYWGDTRTTALTREEMDYIRIQDSIHDYYNRAEYLDSIDSIFNKVTVLKVLWFGIDHRNRAKKTQWTINSLAGTINPIYIAGPRVGPGFYYFKKWENEQTIDGYNEINIGILNSDIKGETNWRWKYDPMHFGYLGIIFDHDFDVIRNYDAFSQILLRDNFIETTTLEINHSYEIANGLFFGTEVSFTERRSLANKTKFITWLDDALDNNDPPEFNTYQALIANFSLSYTPFQKFMREPLKKVILGSKWPTFYAYYEKGLPTLFGSDVDHDYLRLGMRQTFKIGTFGTSTYRIATGKFLRAKVLREIDYKYHRRSDPIWFSNPLFSYQNLDTSLPTQNWYLETHFIHHFNGALINKIPFMKRTRITTVAGTGYLWVPEHNWQHFEFYAGMERVFKISRKRLRIGLYGVLSDGNRIDPRYDFKISFALLDDRRMKFTF